MNNLPIIEITISLVLIYFLLSVMVSSFAEIYNSWIGTRGKILRNSILEVFGKEKFGQKICSHPLILGKEEEKNIGFLKRIKQLITRVFQGKEPFPSFIEPKIFSKCVMDIANPEGKEIDPSSKEGMDFISKSELIESMPVLGKEILKSVVNESDTTGEFQENLAKWFELFANGLTWRFKKVMRIPLFFIGLLVAIVLNVDTINIIKVLWVDDEMRAAVVAEAESIDFDSYADVYLDSENQDSTKYDKIISDYQKLYRANKNIESLRFPIGWKSCKSLGLCKDAEMKSFIFKTIRDTSYSDPDSIDFTISRTYQYDSSQIDYSRSDGIIGSENKLAEFTISKIKDFSGTPKLQENEKSGFLLELSLDESKVKRDTLQAWHISSSNTQVEVGAYVSYKKAKGMAVVRANLSEYCDLWFTISLGWLITAVAISFGAPFWFDLLRKLVSVKK